MLSFRDKIIFLFLFFFLLFLALNRHSKHPAFNYHSEIFTDKAGYHVYLPAFFYYDMDGDKMPKDIDVKTGTGFHIRQSKIITKYPVGVALFELPFFGCAALIDKINGVEKNQGYTKTHYKMINLVGAFYGTLGLLLLFIVGRRFWGLDSSRAYLLVVSVLGCSNLLYYITRDPGMSHLYSFLMFIGILYCFYRFVENPYGNKNSLAILIVQLALVVALRPLNLAFISIPLVYLIWTNREVLLQLDHSKFIKVSLVGLVLGAIPIGIQLAYNQYAYESLMADSYVGESYSNWSHLRLLEFWFGANNGVLIYIPILLFPLIWIFRECKERSFESLLFVGYFLVITITYAAWWSPTLGCGFGHRGFTEHLAFFALPLASVYKSFSKKQVIIAWISVSVVLILLFIAQYNFDDCWRGDGPWDWTEFWSLFRV